MSDPLMQHRDNREEDSDQEGSDHEDSEHEEGEEAHIEEASIDETPVEEASQPDLSDAVWEPDADEVNAIAAYFDDANAVEMADPAVEAPEATSEVIIIYIYI